MIRGNGEKKGYQVKLIKGPYAKPQKHIKGKSVPITWYLNADKGVGAKKEIYYIQHVKYFSKANIIDDGIVHIQNQKEQAQRVKNPANAPVTNKPPPAVFGKEEEIEGSHY